MAKYPKYYVRPDGLHETIIRINGKRKAFRGKTDREVWEKVKAFDRAAAEAILARAAVERLARMAEDEAFSARTLGALAQVLCTKEERE